MLYLACDIGTTTIDIQLITSDGTKLNTDSFRNPQSLYGSDVINRIMNISRNAKLLSIMRKMVVGEIFMHVSNMFSATKTNGKVSLDKVSFDKVSLDKISKICFSGNTTMISILLSLDVKSLGESPFKPLLDKCQNIALKDYIDSVFQNDNQDEDAKKIYSILNDCFDECEGLFLGCSSAFIGGDVLSGALFVEEEYQAKKYLIIDLGTNGEMILNTNGGYYATSTACGPAFEGCVRKQGIYGSTLLQAIDIAISSKNVSIEGVLKEQYLEKGILIQGVLITADILRQVLMAKAAIRTGIDYLLKKTKEDITVYLAGGFGFHLDENIAIKLGLFPKEIRGKIKIIGNSSLNGACNLLTIKENIDRFHTLKNQIEVLNFVDYTSYEEDLISNMKFGQ